jgi:predicted nucleic acid-binding Zn ribbon protein
MIIVLRAVISLKEYLQEYGVRPPAEERKCPICGGRLRRHGRYFRSVVYGQLLERLPVYRYLCPRCEKTFSLLPAFVRPYGHFGLCVREAAARTLAKGGKVDALADRLCRSGSAGGVSGRTLRRWLRVWRQRARALTESVIERILHLVPGFDVTPYLPKPNQPRGWLLSVLALGEILRALPLGADFIPLFVFLNAYYPIHMSL